MKDELVFFFGVYVCVSLLFLVSWCWVLVFLLFLLTFSGPVEWNQTAPATTTSREGGGGRRRGGWKKMGLIHVALVTFV